MPRSSQRMRPPVEALAGIDPGIADNCGGHGVFSGFSSGADAGEGWVAGRCHAVGAEGVPSCRPARSRAVPSVEEREHVVCELGVVLKEEAVRCVGVGLQCRAGDQAASRWE